MHGLLIALTAHGVDDGLIAVAIGEAAEKSIKEGRVVQMSEFNL